MTSPAIAAQKPITYGWAVYRRAAGIHWPDAGRKAIGNATVDLWGALNAHDEHLAARACAELIAAVRQHCGDADADFLAKGGLRT